MLQVQKWILVKVDKQLFMVGVNFIVKSRLRAWITEEWYQNKTGETKDGSAAQPLHMLVHTVSR